MKPEKKTKNAVKKKKITNRRNSVKNPALKPEYNLKTRYESIDYDYVGKLSPDEREWLNNFTEEYTNANFNHDGKKIMKTKKSKKDAYDRNNSRNRCLYTKAKASHSMRYLEDIVEGMKDSNLNPEEKLIQIETIREIIDSIEDKTLQYKLKDLYHTYYYTDKKRNNSN